MTRRWHLARGKVIGVRLPDSVYAIIREQAEKHEMTVSSYTRLLIQQQMERPPESVNALNHNQDGVFGNMPPSAAQAAAASAGEGRKAKGDLKEEAIRLRRERRWSYRRIAAHLNVPKSTVHLWVTSNFPA